MMIVNSAIAGFGPGLAGIMYCAFLWVLTIFLVLCHRSGIQIVGGMIAFAGFISLLVFPHMLFSLTVFFLGCMLHWFGRMLYTFKKH